MSERFALGMDRIVDTLRPATMYFGVQPDGRLVPTLTVEHWEPPPPRPPEYEDAGDYVDDDFYLDAIREHRAANKPVAWTAADKRLY